MGCLVAVVSCSRVVGSATIFIMLIYAVGFFCFCVACARDVGCWFLIVYVIRWILFRADAISYVLRGGIVRRFSFVLVAFGFVCTVKRRQNVDKIAFLTEQVSFIIQCKTLMKYKDPGSPTILVNIGGTYVEKALLDLGASVNLLPYSVYKQLGLGVLKPTTISFFFFLDK